MADEIRELRSDITSLSRRLERIEELIRQLAHELGVREGRQLSNQVDNLESVVTQIKNEVDRIKVDTSDIRKTQEYGSRDMIDIKKALAAIYRNTDELEEAVVEERVTS